MAYVIILIVIALALAPVMALKPSKTQKLQMRLRDRARECGLHVQLCDLPQTHRQQVRREDLERGVCYRLLWRHDAAKLHQFEYRLHRDETEPNAAPPAILVALQQVLANLPVAVLAVEFSSLGVAVYWREAGDVDLVDNIARQLETLQSAVAAFPNII